MRAPRRQTARGLQTLAGQVTATEGPLRRALTELGRFGIGERIVKSALAATIAWLVAAQIPRESAPFVAALTAVYTIDLTILKSLRSAWQRLAGIAVGIVMAFLAAEFLGVHSWTVGLVILISLVIGLRLNLKSDGMTQVAGTAVLVLVVRSTTSERSIYALTFLADTVIGTAIGLAVNSLFSPPNFLPSSRRAINALVDRLVALMDQLATMALDGISMAEATALSGAVTDLGTDLRKADESLQNAEESLRFSPLAGTQRTQIAAFLAADRRLEDTVVRLQRLIDDLGAAHEAPWMVDGPFTESLANLISAATQIVQSPTGQSLDALVNDLELVLADLDSQAERVHRGIADASWRTLGQVTGSARSLAESVLPTEF